MTPNAGAEDAIPHDPEEFVVVTDDESKPLARGQPFQPGNQAAVGRRHYPPAEVERHVQACLHQFQEGNTTWQVQTWGQQEMGWSQSHTWTVIRQARARLVEVTREHAEDARARILALSERMIAESEEYVLGHAEDGSTVFITDPKTGKPLKRKDHKAIQGYQAMIAKLHGLDKTVIEHRGLGAKRPQEMSNDELDAELERVEAELAKRATPVEAEDGAHGLPAPDDIGDGEGDVDAEGDV